MMLLCGMGLSVDVVIVDVVVVLVLLVMDAMPARCWAVADVAIHERQNHWRSSISAELAADPLFVCVSPR